MTLPVLPTNELPPFAPVATRTATVFGAPVELVLVPGRKERPGRTAGSRPAFASSPAERILREEAVWRGNGLVLTPNRFPFAREAWLAWPERATREVPTELWHGVASWVAQSGGSALRNDIGAAATIAHAHVHLTAERLPFLGALPERPLVAEWAPVPGVRWCSKRVPFCLLGARGTPEQLAAALQQLATLRLTATWNVVVNDGAAWVMPRGIETPTPHFAYALGAAEVWGRWCYMDEAPFVAATGADLERALVAAGTPALPA